MVNLDREDAALALMIIGVLLQIIGIRQNRRPKRKSRRGGKHREG